jgi:hypothetical protein
MIRKTHFSMSSGAVNDLRPDFIAKPYQSTNKVDLQNRCLVRGPRWTHHVSVDLPRLIIPRTISNGLSITTWASLMSTSQSISRWTTSPQSVSTVTLTKPAAKLRSWHCIFGRIISNHMIMNRSFSSELATHFMVLSNCLLRKVCNSNERLIRRWC